MEFEFKQKLHQIRESSQRQLQERWDKLIQEYVQIIQNRMLKQVKNYCSCKIMRIVLRQMWCQLTNESQEFLEDRNNGNISEGEGAVTRLLKLIVDALAKEGISAQYSREDLIVKLS